jgi:transposase
MPVPSPYLIVLSAEEEAVLAARARSVRSQYRDRLRAQIVLAAAAGKNNAAIAGQVGMHVDTVRKWRRRFAATRLAGLKDAPRSGRPPVFTAADRAEVIALACALPAESGVPLSKWSCPELARELATRRQIAVSASTIRRWLASDALKPWQHRSWISVRDPAFAAKAARVLDLYAGIWDCAPLGSNDYVICADERPSIRPAAAATPPCLRARPAVGQARLPAQAAAPWLTWPPRRPPRANVVAGEHTTGIAPFSAGQAGDDRELRQRGPGWIVDNGSSTAAPPQPRGPAGNGHLIHLLAHASG